MRKSVIIATLVAASAVVSCKREKRAYTVSATEADVSAGNRNTPLRAGGAGAEAPFSQRSSQPEVEGNAYDLAQGMQLYHAMNCATCHGNYGGGGIGPALSDNEWIYGWHPQIIFDSIVFGRPNGMPSYDGRMTDRQVWQLVAFVRSLSGMIPHEVAPGRGDEMAGAPAPNSLNPPHPRSSTSQRDELQRNEQTVFEQLGWIDPRTGKVRVAQSAFNPTTTASTPPSR